MTRDRLAKAQPPVSRAGLERWISQKAKSDGVVVGRVRRGVSFMVVSAVLARIRSNTGTPLFVLKGGVGMQLRLGSRARTSKDYDAVFREDLATLEAVLEQAPEHPIGQFAVTAGPVEPIGPTGAVRYQIAQKIHACTEVLGHKDNERFTDLLDLLLLEELVAPSDWRSVRQACEEIFTLRGKHAWPPTVTVYPSWREPFAATAGENGFPITAVDEAAAALTSMIVKIANAQVLRSLD